MQFLKSSLKKLFGLLGYDIEAHNTTYVRGHDLHTDLKIILGAESLHILDVGANEGQSAAKYLAHYPQATIHCVEPSPTPLAILRQTYQSEPRVHIHATALGESEGEITMLEQPRSALSSILPLDQDSKNPFSKVVANETASEVTVPITTLDQLISNLAFQDNTPLFLKMDVQGYEIPALKGAHNHLKKQAFKAILLELNFAPIYQKQSEAWEIFKLFQETGYQPVGLYQCSRHRRPPSVPTAINWCDALFVPISSN